MSIVSNLADTIEFKVALLDPSTKMLMATREADGVSLPRVRIPKWTRTAEEINDALREKWQVKSLVLTVLPRKDSQPACVIAERVAPCSAASPCNLELCSIESIGARDLDADERASLSDVVTGAAGLGAPFSRLGWFKEARSWITSYLPGAEFNGDFRQYNASGTFALLRMGTKIGQSYWFKATGEPNKHELSITLELAKLLPAYLPTIVAMREDWNAWVTEDAGKALGDTQNLEILLAAVEALAGLQLLSLDHTSRLEAAGCMNRRLSVVQVHLPEVFSFLEEAMEHQVSAKVVPLTKSRLDEIRRIVEQACERMQELAIPDCLVNGDINLNNILLDDQHFRFTDWAEGGIGNPFLTLQQVIQHVIRDGEHLEWAPRLCDVYKQSWLPALTERQIDQAFGLMPLLTMIDYLYGRGDWLYSSRRDNLLFQGFARTLARGMDRAAAKLLSAEMQNV